MYRKIYPSDVSDDEWAFVASYLTLMTPDAPQRCYALRELFNGVRYVVRTGSHTCERAARTQACERRGVIYRATCLRGKLFTNRCSAG